MRNTIFALAILSVTLICCNDEEFYNYTDQCIFPESFITPCFSNISEYNSDRVIITTQTDYLAFQHAIRASFQNMPCDTAKLPEIDFSKYSLLGIESEGGGCMVDYQRNLYKDTREKKIIYDVKVTYSGFCFMLIGSWNWVYIPKLQSGYSVEFRLEQNQVME